MNLLQRALPATALLLLAFAVPARAARYCDTSPPLSAEQRDKLLRFAAVVKDELQASGARVALVSRSGLDLSRLRTRYSHAGISLLAGAEAPWSVRQLYYACDAGRPRLFDQGMAAFLLGTAQPALGYVSLLLLPPDAAAALERAALDKALALSLVAGEYSANAYPFSERYQNCNQWVAELMAAAWAPARTRAQAQAWLRGEGYAPTAFDVGPLVALAYLLPYLHAGDHPQADLAAGRVQVSMPASVEAFVLARWPAARRIELCHDGARIVVRQGTRPVAEGCVPEPGDRVLPFD